MLYLIIVAINKYFIRLIHKVLLHNFLEENYLVKKGRPNRTTDMRKDLSIT